MAKIKFFRELEASLPGNNISHAGKVFFTESRKIFIYDSSGNPQQITDIIYVADESTMNAIGTPIPLKIYVAIAEGTMWRWETSGSTWEQLGGTSGGSAFLWKGTWSAIAFIVNDVVEYGGSSYIANATTTGSDVPGVSSKWDLMTQKGTDGSSIAWRGAWVAQSYVINNAVEHNGSSYITNDSVVAGDVPGVSSKWDLWVEKGDGNISHVAAGVPSSGLGSNDDVYLNKSTGDYYLKVAGAWVLQERLAVHDFFAKSEIISGTSYTFSAADSGKTLRFTSAANIVATMPAGLSSDFKVEIVRALGGGEISIRRGTSVSLNDVEADIIMTGNAKNARIISNGSDDFTVSVINPAINLRTVTDPTADVELRDADGYIRGNNATSCDVTIQPFATVPMPLMEPVTLRMVGAGLTKFVAGTGVTFNGDAKCNGQNTSVQAVQVATNVWDLTGGVA